MWTLTRLGYEGDFPSPELLPVEGQKVYLARVAAKNNHIYVVCASPVVSRLHCQIEYRNGDWFACDLASMNGTYVNGTELPKSDTSTDVYHWVKLSDGDIIGLGVGVVPDEIEEGRKKSDYFVFKFSKIKSDNLDKDSGGKVMEITISSSSEDEVEQKQPDSKASLKPVTAKKEDVISATPNSASSPVSAGSDRPLPPSNMRPGPQSWKRKCADKGKAVSHSSSKDDLVGTKRKVEDILLSDATKKKHKSDENDAIPSTSKVCDKRGTEVGSKNQSDQKTTPKLKTKNAEIPTKSKQLPTSSDDSSDSEDDFVRSRKEENQSRKSTKSPSVNRSTNSLKRRKLSPARKDRRSYAAAKRFIISDDDSSSDASRSRSSSPSSDSSSSLVVEIKSKKSRAVEVAQPIPATVVKHVKPKLKPRPKLKKLSLKLRRAVEYTDEIDQKIRWDRSTRRQLSSNNLRRIERQLQLAYDRLGKSRLNLKVSNGVGLKGSSSHFNQYTRESNTNGKSSEDKGFESFEPYVEPYQDAFDEPTYEYSYNLSEEEVGSDDEEELKDITSESVFKEPPTPGLQRKAILIEPPPNAFARKRKSINKQPVCFPAENLYNRPIDPAARRSKLRELALKEKERVTNSDSHSTSHHADLPKVKVTSTSRSDRLLGSMLTTVEPSRDIIPLPDQDLVKQMPLSLIGSSMKIGNFQAVVPSKVRQAHVPRDQQTSMKKLMHKGTGLQLSEIAVPPPKVGNRPVQADRPSSSLPRRDQEKVGSSDRKSPVDPEFPYREIANWNPKWLEVKRQKMTEQKNQKEPPAEITKKALVSTLHEYLAYDDYVNIFYPLILNEFWSVLSQEYSGARQFRIDRARKNQDAVQGNEDKQLSILHEFRIGVEGVEVLDECPLLTDVNQDPSSKNTRSGCDFEWSRVSCHAFSYENQKLDRFKDFGIVTLHFNMPDDRNPSKVEPRLVNRKVFCFITYMGDAQKIDSKTEVHKSLFAALVAERREPPAFKTNFHLVLKLTADERKHLHVDRFGDLKKVMYVAAKLRDFRAVLSLGDSVMFERILKPSLKYPVFNPGTVKAPDSASLVPTLLNKLNTSQKFVVHSVAKRILANSEPEVMLLHGPPGTGKTAVIVGLIVQLIKGNNSLGTNMKILVCTPSNTAIDEIIVRVDSFFSAYYQHEARPVMVRLGNEDISKTRLGLDKLAEDRCKQPTAVHSLNKALGDQQKLIEKTEAEISAKRKRGEDITALQHELKESKKRHKKYRDDLNKLQQNGGARPSRKDIDNEKYKLLREANIIFSTLSSCANNFVQRCLGRSKRQSERMPPRITCCIIDEATQTTEPESLAPTLLDVAKMLLVGDPCQLPATVISQEAAANNFGDSLFTRHYNYYRKEFQGGPSPVMYLEFQYRMHPEILFWPNKFFYGGKLKTLQNVTDEITSQRSKLMPYVFVNFEGEESKQSADGKICNSEEVNLIVEILKIVKFQKHVNPRLQNSDWTVGIVTPYKEQKKVILEAIRAKEACMDDALLKHIEVDTIDSFQGREKDVMILSCVRSNALGFLRSPNRLCVALTRARQSLIIIGNAVCLNADPMWKELMNDATSRGLFRKIPNNYAVKPYEARFEIEKAILEREERSMLPEDPCTRMAGVVTSRVQKWPHQHLRNKFSK